MGEGGHGSPAPTGIGIIPKPVAIPPWLPRSLICPNSCGCFYPWERAGTGAPTSYAKVLLLYLSKREAEKHTTRSWDVSIENAVYEIQKTNRRRKAGGHYLSLEELVGANLWGRFAEGDGKGDRPYLPTPMP